jgi:hypothetical protein
VQITRTPVLVVAKNLIKIMRGENLELNWRGRLSVLAVGHTLYTTVSSVPSTVYQLILNVLHWKYTNTIQYIHSQSWRTEKLLWLCRKQLR